MSKPSNLAALITGPNAHPLVVQPHPYPAVQDGTVIIKARAVAINPADCKFQQLAMFSLEYPLVLGFDVAGEIVELGQGVDGLAVGDRVLAFTGWLSGPPSIGTFAHYTRALANVVTRIPPSLSFTDAAVLPVAVGTASAILYESDKLALPFPSLNPPTSKRSSILFVWGGSTAVGTSTIQLARASGLDVYSSASPSNLDYLRALGCTQVFDRTSPSLVHDVVASLEREGKKKLVGLVDSISDDSTRNVCRSLANATGLSLVIGTNPRANATEDGVEYRNVAAFTIKTNEVGEKIFKDFLEPALATGEFNCLPQAEVIGKGLKTVQGAMDRLAKGVSAKKLVVDLQQ